MLSDETTTLSDVERQKLDVLSDYILQKQARRANRKQKPSQASRSAQNFNRSAKPGTNRDNVRHQPGPHSFAPPFAPDRNSPCDPSTPTNPGVAACAEDNNSTRTEHKRPRRLRAWHDIFIPDPEKLRTTAEPLAALDDPRLLCPEPKLAADDDWMDEVAQHESTAGPSATEPMTGQQHELLERLLRGDTVSEAAQDLGISRRTLHRWLALPAVAAELRRQQQQLSAGFRTRVAAWAEQAVEAVEWSLKRGSVKTALGLIKGVGLLNGRPLTETDEPLLCECAEEAPEPAETAVDSGAASDTNNTPITATTTVADICETADNADATCGLLEELPLRQQIALGHLLFGDPPQVARAKARVRQGLWQRWLREDATFRHALQACRREMQNALHAQLLRLLPIAFDLVEQALLNCDGQVGLAVLRGLGLCKNKQPIGWGS